MLLPSMVAALLVANVYAVPANQVPLGMNTQLAGGQEVVRVNSKSRDLKGRFLHITDFHPDPFYKLYSSTEEDCACHRGDGPAGVFGAETSDCDSPIMLINATFQWINDNLKDQVDFIIWTGDSARHDNDGQIPRTPKQVLDLNEMLVNKFTEVFGKDDGKSSDLTVPIVPTFGNNDILPHNIMYPGPNYWTRHFSNVWKQYIPEEQRHSFERGGWFFVEVIPKQLAVFSLNTIYFFDSNTAVDGCALKSEPGYEHMEWLRIQLQRLRDRGMKAIITGHVPPARTESKQSWDETCWQKYALWMQQYRDVVVGSVYGHMNIDHFMLQDFKEIKKKTRKGRNIHIERSRNSRTGSGGEATVQTKSEYLAELRTDWKQIPDPPKSSSAACGEGFLDRAVDSLKRKSKKHKKSKEEKYLDKIGGPWGERYALTLVSPSVVPNYFPTMRVIEYNISGIDSKALNAPTTDRDFGLSGPQKAGSTDDPLTNRESASEVNDRGGPTASKKKKKKHNKKKKKKKHHQTFPLPLPPSKSSPPGPAYSPQLFTWLGYTQYYANLTRINSDFPDSSASSSIYPPLGLAQQRPPNPDSNSNSNADSPFSEKKWHNGKHSGKETHHHHDSGEGQHHAEFRYEVEYDTRNDSVWALEDLTVGAYLELARRIAGFKPGKDDGVEGEMGADEEEERCEWFGGESAVDNDDDVELDEDVVVNVAGKADGESRREVQISNENSKTDSAATQPAAPPSDEAQPARKHGKHQRGKTRKHRKRGAGKEKSATSRGTRSCGERLSGRWRRRTWMLFLERGRDIEEGYWCGRSGRRKSAKEIEAIVGGGWAEIE